MAETLILHHYDASPFSEKIRKIFGLKGLKWRAVEQPSIMPKPDLVPLTGGYRRIPVLQIGADVYCDTQVIVRLLERLHPAPTLYPGGSEGTCHAWNLWADRLLFLPLVAAVFAETWQFLPPEFIADRTRMVPGRNFGELPKLGPPAREQVRALLAIIEAQLADGGPYLLGTEPSLADATCFQQVWFLRVAPQANAMVEEFRRVSAWRDRVDALGHGERVEMPPSEALAIAKESRPTAGWRPPLVALLLVGSGFCALVYEVAWLRMLRLVFGVSTAASAAVLAIFLGGLGLGGLLLGRRADRAPSPLRLYADLETGVAVAAAATPLLVAVVARLYFLLGGTAVLGLAGATVLRLALAVAVLGLPAVLMGGTLPAAVRAVERGADAGRRGAGLLYGANTLGAGGGSLYATFLALELLGTNLTVWSASLLNLVVALAARLLAARAGAPAGAPPESAEPAPAAAAPAALVLVAAAFVGFAFLLMELVWYRMLAPLLGGSTYTF